MPQHVTWEHIRTSGQLLPSLPAPPCFQIKRKITPCSYSSASDVIHSHETCLSTTVADYFGGVQVDGSMSSKSDNNI